MDHEFFTHSLESNQSGWDWFSLQFRNGSELMLYRIRLKDGSVEPYSSGTYVAADGKSTHLTSAEYTLEPRKLPTRCGRVPRRRRDTLCAGPCGFRNLGSWLKRPLVFDSRRSLDEPRGRRHIGKARSMCKDRAMASRSPGLDIWR